MIDTKKKSVNLVRNVEIKRNTKKNGKNFLIFRFVM